LLLVCACLSEPSAFNKKLAEISCEQAKECEAEKFELTCQAACTADEECPSERCNRITGVCRDDDGPLPTDAIGEPCSSSDDCGGGPICVQVFDSLDECVDEISDYWETMWTDHCDYDPPLARECIKAVKKRDCDDELPSICGEVYGNCVF
jgi:hypothetical protein